MTRKLIIILGALLCSGCQSGQSKSVFDLLCFDCQQTVKATELVTPLSGSTETHDLVVKKAQSNNVPPALALSIVQVESRFEPKAYHSGNYGLGQIRCGTAKGIGYTGSCLSLFDPTINMDYSMKYLSMALDKSIGDWCHAATLYNRGLGSKSKTSSYCRKVMKQIKDPN